MKNLLYSVFVCSLFFACNSSSDTAQSDEAKLQQMMDSANAAPQDNRLPEATVGEILNQIPSPIETSVLIKKTGGIYNKEILNPSENAQGYSTNYKKALNLGVYGADLGYINIYEKNKESLYYLNSIKSMADGLNIGQFFDFETIKRLANNNKNADSLLNITTDNFNKINSFLYEQKRSDQSVLILTGGWLEGLNIMCQIAQKNKNPKLYERIGEQKVIIEKLVLVLANYEADANIKLLNNDLKQLQEIYKKVEITTIYKGATTEIVDGIPTIVDKSESKVNITDAQVVELAKLTSAIRNKVVS
jgi:hypothetical protein